MAESIGESVRLGKTRVRPQSSTPEGPPLNGKIQCHLESPCEDKQEELSREITEMQCRTHQSRSWLWCALSGLYPGKQKAPGY